MRSANIGTAPGRRQLRETRSTSDGRLSSPGTNFGKWDFYHFFFMQRLLSHMPVSVIYGANFPFNVVSSLRHVRICRGKVVKFWPSCFTASCLTPVLAFMLLSECPSGNPSLATTTKNTTRRFALKIFLIPSLGLVSVECC